MPLPEITCIIPTFNDRLLVPRAVASALGQQGVAPSVLLVDDGSDADTRAFLAQLAASDPRIRLFLMPQNSGQSQARNLGAMLATTPLICFLDQDDQYLPGWFEVAATLLAQRSDIGVLSGKARFCDLPARFGIDESDIRLVGLSHVFITNMVFRRSVFLASGGFPVGDFWRTDIAGEDGVYRYRVGQHWHAAEVLFPALLHSAKEGGATAFFLDRSRVVEGKVEIVDAHPAERDGTYFQAMEAFWQIMDRHAAELRGASVAAADVSPVIPVAAPAPVAPKPDLPALPMATADGLAVNASLDIYRYFTEVPALCIKHESYFQVYEALVAGYRGLPITFVEVGVYNGGSLAMWRRFLGPQARIIGVDLNPGARRWEADGFEIFIGDQSSETFWQDFYETVGPIDVLLDDGGHMNHQQIITADHAIARIRDGGMLLVEDTHTSYMSGFNAPPAQSFVAFAKRMVEHINARSKDAGMAPGRYSRKIWSVAFYESVIAFQIDSRRCFDSAGIANLGAATTSVDYRHAGLSPQDIPDLSRFFD